MAEGDGMDEALDRVTSRTVFLSYASQDAEIANTVCGELESRGIRCWIAPRDVAPGALYADAIVRAINESNVLVIVLSQSAVASSHVGREIERAASKRKPIIALRIDTAPLSPELEYFLSNCQWIDVAALGRPGALAKLAQAVGQGPTASSRVDPVLGPAPVASGTSGNSRPVGVRRGLLVASIIVALGAAVALAFHFSPTKHADTWMRAVDKSIAVLPFADMSQKKDQEYFGDGMAEEILDLLAKIPGLTVIGRTSSFQFKGKNEDLRTIGTKLNAAYVLEGSVRNSGDQVRITAQLINTKTGAHEWSETYDRPFGDVLKLQDAIAAAVARELQLSVAPGYLQRSDLRNPDAYELLLRGRHASDRLDRDGLDEAVTLFRQAIERDPTSADARAALAWTYDAQGEWGFVASTTAFDLAHRIASEALQLDPKNALAHFVLGRLHLAYDWDWAAAEREFMQVEKLAPGKGATIDSEALLSMALGRWDDALRQVKAALVQDPLDPPSLYVLTEVQLRLGHVAEAELAVRRALDIRATLGGAHYLLGLVLLARGLPDAALHEMQREATDSLVPAGLAIADYALGRKADSDVAIAQMVKDHAQDSAFNIAEVYAFRNQPNDAMYWLERAYVQKDAGLYFIKVEMPQNTLAADPRFKAFLKKMNLPE
jgi:TolB-like protein